MDIEKHKRAGQAIVTGVSSLLANTDSKAPTPFDLIEVLEILEQKIQQSNQYKGIPFYVPVRKNEEKRTEHDFKRDIMGEMKELLTNPVHPFHTDVDYTGVIKFMVSPIMNRLGLFTHEEAMFASGVIISKTKTQILAEC